MSSSRDIVIVKRVKIIRFKVRGTAYQAEVKMDSGVVVRSRRQLVKEFSFDWSAFFSTHLS